MNKLKYATVLCFAGFYFSCSNTPFVNHKLKADKTGTCTNDVTPDKITITSNINGEHYEFECCLSNDFDAKNYTVERKNDSLVVIFPSTAGSQKALYKMVLDIDAKPAYKHISINGFDINMKPAER